MLKINDFVVFMDGKNPQRVFHFSLLQQMILMQVMHFTLAWECFTCHWDPKRLVLKPLNCKFIEKLKLATDITGA